MAESYIIKRVKKRNGSIALFDEGKIEHAVTRAFSAVGKESPERVKEIAKKVIDILELFFKDNGLPSVESIQDLVEKTLIVEGEAEVAKAYILYRKQHEELRESRSFALDVQKTMDGYLAKTDWRVAENSNMNYSLSGLLMHLAGSMMAHYTLNKVYPEHIAKAHIEGDFHIHDLSMGIAGYCAGWSLRQLLEEGFNGVSGRTESTPPKHLGSALWQMINFIGTLQNEWAGAQAFSSFDTYLAPFVKADRLSYDDVHHAIQGFVFNMNIPSRWGGQCVSDDTQALTDNGWKFCDEIELKKDKIATFNIKTGSIDYLSPSRVKSYPYSGDLIRITNRTQDQLVTPNHRVVRKKFNVKGYALEEAEALMSFKTGILVPNSGITDSKKEIAACKVELLAWLVAEGTFSENRKRVAVYQSEKNHSNVRKIRACLKDNGFRWDETKRVHGFGKSPMIRFRLSQESSRKVRETINEKQIPPFIASLSAPQIKLFLENYILGDGHRERKGRVRIYSKDTGVVDAIQELCALVGWGTSINIRENGVSQINIIRNQNTLVKLSRAAYHGKVWCPTTENGTFVARRNGTVFVTGNTPFSNITLDWVCPEDMKKKKTVVGGKRQEFSYGECQEEMDMINRAFIEVMAKGDAKGRVFTFPIPTYNITRDFNWDSENAKLLFEMTAKYGLPYFQNFINSTLNPGDVRSMCCRLQMDMRELRTRGGGLFGSGEMTGSIGVVTINLPRIGYLSKSREEFFKRIEKLMEMGRDSLEIKRKLVEHNMEKGLMPFSKRYLGSVHNHFSTIGIVGMNEALQNFFGSEVTTASKQGREFTMEVLDFMRNKLAAFQEETKHMYNLEATPAEGTSYRLARIDKRKYPEIISAGKGQPYYTNSTQLPVNYTEDIFEALELQDSLQAKYTGGTVLHGFLGEKISDAESCKRLVKRIAENFRLPYFTITPTFSICPAHGYVAGEHFTCPHSIGPASELMAGISPGDGSAVGKGAVQGMAAQAGDAGEPPKEIQPPIVHSR